MPVDAYAIDRFSDVPADCGSDLPPGLSFEQWLEIGSTLKGAQHSLMWRLGDWLAYGEKRSWGAKYDKAVEDTGISNGILRNAKWIAKQFPLSRRRDKLMFAHHQEVASLPPEEAEALLDEAEAKKLSRNDLRVRVARSRPRRRRRHG